MRLRRNWIGMTRVCALAGLTGAAGLLVTANHAGAEERKFAVMLAHSPKTFANEAGVPGLPPGGLTNPSDINRQYFDHVDLTLTSFAEFWEENSYGDVTVTGRTFGWITLPWAFEPGGPDPESPVTPVSFNGLYGAPEFFCDTHSSEDDFVEVNDTLCGSLIIHDLGVDSLRLPGLPDGVWTPGERFLDLDGDGRWDGGDERDDQFCAGDDGCSSCTYRMCTDNRGFRCSTDADCSTGECVVAGRCQNPFTGDYDDSLQGRNLGCLSDADCSDPSFFSCQFGGSGAACTEDGDCPDRGREQCGDPVGSGPRVCLTRGCGDLGMPCVDWDQDDTCTNADNCVIPTDVIICTVDADDVCPPVLILTPAGQEVTAPICLDAAGPDQPRYCRPADDCVPTGPDGPTALPVCCDDPATPGAPPGCLPNANPGVECGDPIECCEFDDANNSGSIDVVEPFEDFIVRNTGAGKTSWTRVTEQYIRDNYPGDIAALIRRTGNGFYDPPDLFVNAFDTKMVRDGYRGATPKPGMRKFSSGLPLHSEYRNEEPWFDQWWEDTYGSTPPAWPGGAVPSPSPNSPNMVPLNDPLLNPDDDDAAFRIRFNPNRGGWTGAGRGTAANPNRSFIGTGNAEAVLPEERFGFYDGWVEHDDVASSKYHTGGDLRFGEITSPTAWTVDGEAAISGVDLGLHTPDRLPIPDGFKVAAGPYAVNIHGEKGFDAGDVAIVELLTWRTDGASPTIAYNWSRVHGRSHAYASPSGLGLGFRDFNLDGIVDQGAVRPVFSENYTVDSDSLTINDGVDTNYPFNRQRLIEDVIEALDPSVDWDDFIDSNSMDVALCSHTYWTNVVTASDPKDPSNPNSRKSIEAEGFVSGIVLTPRRSFASDRFARDWSFFSGHNEDNDDRAFKIPDWPTNPFVAGESHRNLNLWFHNMVTCIGCQENDDFAPRYSAAGYAWAWQGWPDLFDYDREQVPQVDEENCPIGEWDLMAEGGMVHSLPVLKSAECTDWIVPVDLAASIAPGVETVVTFPAAEIVRDSSYYFLENPDRPGEKYWFWSAGSGIDDPDLGGLPGAGLLILHTDADGANPEELPLQQRTPPWSYLIVQADGLNQMEACQATDNRGDAGDAWPGTTENTTFNFHTNPSATWYGESKWTGLDISNIELDENGSARVTLTWIPTSIPSLRFIRPPGGETVGKTYQVRFNATDVYGGTTIQFFATPRSQPDLRFGTDEAVEIGKVRKTVPGTVDRSINWDITGFKDGSYFLFAKLIPGLGSDGTELKSTAARPGLGNQGDGSLTVLSVSIDDDDDDDDDKARSETWTIKCIDPDGIEWKVASTLSYPEDADDDPLSPDPSLIARTNVTFHSPGGEVSFKIRKAAKNFAQGDTFTFTTTGYTAKSRGVEIKNGRITEGPTAVLDANVFTGPPPLDVEFDARRSTDPNNQPLTFEWDFADGTGTVVGPEVSHRFETAGTFTVQLKATNPLTTRFDVASQDIIVINNTPSAKIKAKPDSGPPPLTVQFNAEDSSDKETDNEDLIYFWNFGDGKTANDAGEPGVLIKTEHFYSVREDGSACTVANPCSFVAELTVTDVNGAEGKATIEILVGNSRPVPVIDVDPLEGPAPLEVSFDASGSFDPDGDTMTIDWDWDDNTTTKGVNLSSGGSNITTHKYAIPGTYRPTAVLTDQHGAFATWAGEEIIVAGNRPPNAVLVATPKEGFQNLTTFTFDARQSRDPDSEIESYRWTFGDGSSSVLGSVVEHTYSKANPTGFTVVLTVTDDRGATGTDFEVIIVKEDPGNQGPVAHIATLPAACALPCTLTLDGSLSFDPNDDPLQFDWLVVDEEGNSDSARGPSILVRNFEILGTYSISLTVTETGPNSEALSDTAGPFVVVVVPPGTTLPPPIDPPSTRPPPTEPPDSADQRPPSSGFCGLGMVMSLFGSLFGLTAMAVARRRRFGF